MAQAMICDGCNAATGDMLVTDISAGEVMAWCGPCFVGFCSAVAATVEQETQPATSAPDGPVGDGAAATEDEGSTDSETPEPPAVSDDTGTGPAETPDTDASAPPDDV